MEIPASFQNSLRLLFDKFLSDRPGCDQIFGYAENFFLNERTEIPKISHALLSLKYNLHSTENFTMHVAEIFDTLLTRQTGGSSSLQVVPVSEAVKLVTILLQKPSDALYSSANVSSSYSSSSSSASSGSVVDAASGTNPGNVGNGYTLTIFENMVINDVKNTLEFREFESLLRLSFILVEMDEWLNEILPHIKLDSAARKVHVLNTYQDFRANGAVNTSIRTLNDEIALQGRLLSLFENDIVSFEEFCKSRDTNSDEAVSLILSELFRGYLKEGEENTDVSKVVGNE